jgi:hypothetical protein
MQQHYNPGFSELLENDIKATLPEFVGVTLTDKVLPPAE